MNKFNQGRFDAQRGYCNPSLRGDSSYISGFNSTQECLPLRKRLDPIKEKGLGKILTLEELRDLDMSKATNDLGELMDVISSLGRTNGYLSGLFCHAVKDNKLTDADEAYLLTVQKFNALQKVDVLYSACAQSWAESYNSQQRTLGSRKRIRPIQEGRNYGIVFEKT
ncbi:hypothetical protein KA107_02895 [Candidatus Pacearchaeota archaeon]|nr:hypothetical protein [Candidatus Pacearchaeota archaeon]